jgi:hypothetical protein
MGHCTDCSIVTKYDLSYLSGPWNYINRNADEKEKNRTCNDLTMETKTKRKNQPQRLMLPLLWEDVIQSTSMISPIDTAEEKGKLNKQNTAEIIELPKTLYRVLIVRFCHWTGKYR